MTITDQPSAETARTPPSRWKWPVLGLAGVLLIAAAGAAGWWIGSSGDGESTETVVIVDQWADAFLDGDPDAVAALFTDEGVYEERGPTHVFEGTAAIRQQLEEGFLYGDATGMEARSIVVAHDVLSGSDVVIVDWAMSGLSAPGTRDPFDKTPFSVQAVTVFEMEDGLISRSVFYAPWADLFN